MAATRQLHINGQVYTTDADPEARLLRFVWRDPLELTGTKYGCSRDQRGPCTVLLDGKARRSCITPLGDIAQNGRFSDYRLPRFSEVPSSRQYCSIAPAFPQPVQAKLHWSVSLPQLRMPFSRPPVCGCRSLPLDPNGLKVS